MGSQPMAIKFVGSLQKRKTQNNKDYRGMKGNW